MIDLAEQTPFSLSTKEKFSKTNIDALIDSKQREGKTIEYKSQLPNLRDKREKSKFLASISSFANTVGGHILYGIEEGRDTEGQSNGFPESAIGIAENPDSAILQMENMIRSNIRPRIPSLHIYPVEGFTHGPVIVCSIQKSWIGPHMLTHRASPFYGRGSNGKVELDVDQICDAFTSRESIPEKIRSIRLERLAALIAGETIGPFEDFPKLLLHIIPHSAFEFRPREDFSGKVESCLYRHGAIYNRWQYRHNFDGYFGSKAYGDERNVAEYLQVFRNGTLEYCNNTALKVHLQEEKCVPSVSYEMELIKVIPTLFQLAKDLGIQSPFYLVPTVTDIKDYFFAMKRNVDNAQRGMKIDRNVLPFEPTLVENPDEAPGTILRPFFDAFWQASGYTGSENYDECGNWVCRPK
jgi:hypothetical protein